jgi:NADPH:quinone reductase-like Zn-dependent oxidoreductase
MGDFGIYGIGGAAATGPCPVPGPLLPSIVRSVPNPRKPDRHRKDGTMRAWRISEHGDPASLKLEELPDPLPGPGEAVIRVEAVGMNHLDLWVRRGVPGHRYPLPLTPGCDAAGTVTALGPGTRSLAIGDEVVVAPGIGCGACLECQSGRDALCRHYGILGETRDGTCAESLALPATHVLPRPANLTVEEAACVPLTLLTAWHMLVARAGVKPGETVLVQAAGSGVGVMAIQIGRLLGARVIATAGSAEKAARARELGADETILYRDVDFLEEVRRLTGKRGVDVVIEHVGQETWERSVRALAKGGRLVTCGSTSGPLVSLDLRLLFFKSLSLLGSTMGGRGELTEAMRFVASGAIRPVLDRVFPMEELPAAHAHLEARRAFGKVVLRGFGR